MTATATFPDPAGTSIGPYAIVRPLGSGGMAQVFLALKYGASGFERHVAIKTLKPEHQGNAHLERLLIEEAKIGARFDHPNLVQVHDLGVDRGRYYVCMDFVDGADLGSLLEVERPSPGLALYIAQQVASGLAYVHALRDPGGRPLGLVHRDVSPTNILLSASGRVRLADFGIAKATLLADITWGRFRKGKYAYMSPEQLEGDKLTPQSDQFAFAVTLCEMLTGRRPFDAETPLETMDRIRRAESPEVSEVPWRIRRAVRRCLAKDPGERYPDPIDLLDAVARLRRHYRPASGPDEVSAYVRGGLEQPAKDSLGQPTAEVTAITARLSESEPGSLAQ